jgi:polyphosphate kinase 2 (PPK2 family)
MKLKLEDGEPHSVAAPPVVGGLKRETAVDTIDLAAKLQKAEYEELRDKYQKVLSELSDRKAMSKTGVVLVFQGNDAAGKGGRSGG